LIEINTEYWQKRQTPTWPSIGVSEDRRSAAS
jgi:hypothetical protein